MADNRIYNHHPILPINRSAFGQGTPVPAQGAGGQVSFDKVLQQQLTSVKFSSHALQRMQSRNINLDQTQLAKLSSAVDKAAQKGARESLVLMNNDLALVVSVKNRTVITAIDGASIKDNVFTNIDSAVVI